MQIQPQEGVDSGCKGTDGSSKYRWVVLLSLAATGSISGALSFGVTVLAISFVPLTTGVLEILIVMSKAGFLRRSCRDSRSAAIFLPRPGSMQSLDSAVSITERHEAER